VVKFQIVDGAAFNASALVTPPHFVSSFLGNRLPLVTEFRNRNIFARYQIFRFLLLLAHRIQKNKTGPVSIIWAINRIELILVDKNDTDESGYLWETGRSNDFTSNFNGQVKGSFQNRVNNLMKLWITTKGIPNICPGDTVDIFFPHNLGTSQYSGFWLVERVVQMVGDIYLTKLLLTRTGLDTDFTNTLMRSLRKKKS